MNGRIYGKGIFLFEILQRMSYFMVKIMHIY